MLQHEAGPEAKQHLSRRPVDSVGHRNGQLTRASSLSDKLVDIGSWCTGGSSERAAEASAARHVALCR